MENVSLEKATDVSTVVGSAMVCINTGMILALERIPTLSMAFWYLVILALTMIATTSCATLATTRFMIMPGHLGTTILAWLYFFGTFVILLLTFTELLFGRPFIWL